MTKRTKIIVFGGTIALIVAGYFALPGLFSYITRIALHEQGVQNEAAKPLIDAVVADKIKVGDSVEHAKQVLAYAGLPMHIETFEPKVTSIYRTGKGCGFTIEISFDSQDTVTKVVVHPFFTWL